MTRCQRCGEWILDPDEPLQYCRNGCEAIKLAPPFLHDRDGVRYPNPRAPAEKSGVNAGKLSWPQQHILLQSLRGNRAFARELVLALLPELLDEFGGRRQ